MKITILGCGVMGSAFATQWAKKKGYSLILCDRNKEKGEELARKVKGSFIPNVAKAISKGELILLAIKPKDLNEIAKHAKGNKQKVFLSILAGVNTHHFKKCLPQSQVVRSMPNLALTCGQSVIALVNNPSITERTKQIIEQALEGLGLVFWTEETKIDAVSALAGSGPAFIIAMIESIVESGIGMGLSSEEALKLALQTVIGAVALIQQHCSHSKNMHPKHVHPGGVRWQISSPAGTTIQGMKMFEEKSVRSGIIDTFLATFQANKEIQ